MASQAIGLDDIMATLMTMGFEYQDCQDAITNGKLTVQSAVDWLLSGKPGNVVSDQPTLRLNQAQQQQAPSLQGDSSNPFVERNVSTLTEDHSLSESSTNQGLDVDMVDSSVVSRSHLSEKQQHIKQAFEEKERVAARKTVQDEKRKQKLEKERILKEIQADREKQRLTKQQRTDPPPAAATSSSTMQCDTQTSPASSSKDDKSDDDKALIQVRLPSGQMFRQAFSASESLNKVWDAVADRIKTAIFAHQGFIQPFPRREFSKQEMSQSLRDLGLTPSGSLVLKKKDVEQASVRVDNDPGGEEEKMDSDGGEEMEDGVGGDDHGEVGAEGVMDERGIPGHRWGRGFRVDDVNNNPAQNIDFEDAANALAHNPFGENDVGMFDEEEAEAGPAFEGFGMRLVPEGVPADDGHHLQRRARDLAAEAAAQRFAQPQPVQEPEPPRSHSELKYSARTLQDLSMCILARRIVDPRMPLVSMNGLSNDLLQAFLSYLKKERILNPKILLLMPSYLLKLNLDFYPYATNEVLHAARVLVNLHHISLNSCTLITDAGLVFLKGMKALRSLSLQNCGQITDLCVSAFSGLATLQSLNLEGTKLTDDGVRRFVYSGSCPQLAQLNVGRTHVTHEIIPTLAKFEHLRSLCLKQNKVSSLSGIETISNLEFLDVSDTDIVSDSLLCLSSLPNLKHLCLTGTQKVVGDTALKYLQELKLTSLALPCRNSTTDIGMTYIIGFRLSALDLTNYTNVGDAGMLSVGQITSLKTLLLTNTRITNEGMPHLAGLRNLEVFSVDKTLVSNTGVAVVQNFTNLTELSLATTSVTSELLKQGTLNSCLMLSKLNLSRTIVGDRGLQCLRLPCLSLLNLDCTRAHEYIEDTIRTNCPNMKHITFANLSTVPEDQEVE